MGLETQDAGGDDGSGFKSAPGLAQVMQDEGTRDQNANILNLFLDNTTLQGGAPAPITQFVGTLDVSSSSVVFNGNFTRERYGKAAVSDNITLDSDRRSLLLDNNQTDEQKATSILSALEFDNGLTAVQNMSDGDVTGTAVPDNIDFFTNRPNSIYLNTAKLNGVKASHLSTAFVSVAEQQYVETLVSQAGGTPAGFTSFGDVVSDQSLMQSISADALASSMLSNHPNGATALAGSQTARDAFFASQDARRELADSPTGMREVAASQAAMQEVAASQAVMQEVAASQVAMQEVAASQTAVQEVAASQVAMQEVAASQTAMQEAVASQAVMQEVAASQTAMQEVAASQTAMQEAAVSQVAMDEIIASQTAVQEVAASQTAMQEVAASQTAMQEVAASETAMSAIGDNLSITENTVLNSSVATSELSTSPLKETITRSYNSGSNASGNLTNDTVLVTSNNDNGDKCSINFTNVAGPETEEGTTFVISEANFNNNSSAKAGGSVSIDVISYNEF